MSEENHGFSDFLSVRKKIAEQRGNGDAAASLTFDEAEGLVLLAREVWELRRTKSAAEADARSAGYKEGQRDLQRSIAAMLGL